MADSLKMQNEALNASYILLAKTPLEKIHHRLGAKMVPFAGYEMPIQYPTGIMAEHHHTRQSAGLFDVSHMGAVEIIGDQATKALENLIPCDLAEMSCGEIRYGVFLLESGCVLDDLLITRRENGYLLVINASRKSEDIKYLQSHLPADVILRVWENPVMIALQGPKAADVLERFYPKVSSLLFMTGKAFENTWISRSGYTGEDGFEILAPQEEGISMTEKLLAESEVKPIGLGARDSLRLEAGLCLYGHELNENTTPVEAGIAWSIGKRRRQVGEFLGADRILAQLKEGVSCRRVGMALLPGSIPREGAEVLSEKGNVIGFVSSGGHSPTLGHPISMGYVDQAQAAIGTDVLIQVRGQARAAKVVKMPFVPHAYFKK
jgi:aminomethyltransferase